MGATKKLPVVPLGYLHRNIFCDATADFIMFNNEYIAKQIETACTRGPRHAGFIDE